MSKTKLYIAGKVTGLDRKQTLLKFERAELKLKQYYRVVNPTRIVPPGASWELAMRQCIIEMLDCQVVYMLNDWEDSDGAKVERDIATICGIEIQYEDA